MSFIYHFIYRIILTADYLKKGFFFFLTIIMFGFVNNLYAQQDTIFFHSKPSDTIASDSAVIQFLSDADIPVTTNNKIHLLKSGKEKFDDLFSAIKKAKHHIHLEYFNFRNDSIANELFTLLAHKAQEGVEIRALFDAFGNWSNSRPLKKKHLKNLRKKGIEIYHFDPLRFPYINHVFHRDHRKIVVIDGTIAYVGGMNIADYYIKGLPEIGEWRDMHVRIEGKATHYLQEIFLSIWNKTTKQNISGTVYFPIYSDTTFHKGKSIAIVDRTPKKSPKQIRQTYAKSIDVAKSNIQIVNPYFLPTRSIRKALKSALKRGINVEIMISAKADIAFTPEGSIRVAHNLMKKGAHIYLYNGGFHHSKVMMIDSTFCTVGTANLDSRSLRYDYEVNAFIFDKEITEELSEIFEKDKQNCTMLTPEEWRKRSVWKRFVGLLAQMCTPFL